MPPSTQKVASGWAPSVNIEDNANAGSASSGIATFIDIKTGAPGTLRFRVDTDIPLNDIITLEGVVLDISNATVATAITVAAKAISTSTGVDYDLTSKRDAVTFGKQFGVSVGTKLDETIDVAAAGNTFLSTATVDSLVFTIANTPLSLALTTTSGEALNYSASLTGEFGQFIVTTAAANTAAKKCAFITGSNTSPAITVTKCEADNIVFTTSAAQQTVEFDVAAASALGKEFTISPSDFTATFNVEYDVSAAEGDETDFTIASDVDAGTWTLDGTVVNVSYMPYRSNITQIINVTNRSGKDGDVYVFAYAEDGTKYNLGKVATVEAGSIMRISGDILDALTTKTGVDHNTVGSTTRYAFELVTSVAVTAANDVEVYSAYNVGGSGARLVVNSSNGAM